MLLYDPADRLAGLPNMLLPLTLSVACRRPQRDHQTPLLRPVIVKRYALATASNMAEHMGTALFSKITRPNVMVRNHDNYQGTTKADTDADAKSRVVGLEKTHRG